jgi:hypothetical protein
MLYLAYVGHDLDVEESGLEGPWTEVRPLAPGLLFVDSEHSRSPVYHALKDHLPPRTPLLVAELDEVPKLSRMAPGALAWARAVLAR